MSQTESADQRPRQRIYDAREAMHEARLQLRSELMAGSAGREIRQRFCAVLTAYYDVLKEHRDDAVLDPSWEDRGVDWIDRRSTSFDTQKIAPKGTAYGTRTVEINRLVQTAPRKLLEAADKLDKIARDLGFAAATKDHTPGNEWDNADLLALMSCREQDALTEVYDALDIDLGGDDDGDGDDGD